MNRLITFFILVSLVLAASTLFAQDELQTQTVTGEVIDADSEMPLIGATIKLIGSDPVLGVTTDLDGAFRLEGVPVGRQSFEISYIGYKTSTVNNILVSAGKMLQVNIKLEESVEQLQEVVVSGETDKNRALNENTSVSARTFSIDEVTRYSGARNDVARMVSNYAGVSVGNDARNDIVVRGNSPTGVQWRLEGIDIPNPNHYSTLGTTGGPVSAVNPNLIDNSDFLTGAFPSEYGNVTAGVFDLNFRSGNRERFEATAQLGAFSGLEAMIEGPFSKRKKATYLFSYRYSFAAIAAAGTSATPIYQDINFHIDLPNTKAGKFSFFGIGGTSKIDFIGAEIDTTDLFADPNADSYVRSKLGIIGMKHNIIVGQKGYFRTVITASTSQSTYEEDNYDENGMAERVTESDDIQNQYTINSFYNHKFSPKYSIRAGVKWNLFNLNLNVRDRKNRDDWYQVRDFDGNVNLFQAFFQNKIKFNDRVTLNVGLNAMYLTNNQSYAIEPRIGLSYQVAEAHTLSLGYGIHHQMQALPVYFYETELSDGSSIRTNEDLDFLRSKHFVLGYDYNMGKDWRLKAELYYQKISNAAVETDSSSFSMLNAGDDFVFPERDFLTNEGTGSNYGIEITVEKFFSKGYYGLLTVSLFDSKYEGSDGIERNTAFNSNYVVNFLAGKEFIIGKEKRNAITFDMKVTSSGGRYYTPIDLEASRAAGEEVLIEEEAYSLRQDPYFRLDAKLGFRLNAKKKRISQTFFVDFQNLTNRQNIFRERYNPVTENINTVYQQGFFPDILYRVQF